MYTVDYLGTNATFFFNGTIDEVEIYNRALSQQEIQGDMIPEFPTPLILLLPMLVIPLIVLVYKKRRGNPHLTSAF